MGSTFFKRYELARDEFYKTTKEYPQLKVAADGHAKSSGVADDLKSLDALLDGDEADPARLTKIYQDFEKHARSYAQQLTLMPGKGLIDKKGTETDKPTKEKIVKACNRFADHLQVLLKDVEGTMKVELKKGASLTQAQKVLAEVCDEIAGWSKYVDLAGVKTVKDPASTKWLNSAKTGSPATDVVRACGMVKDACSRFESLLKEAGKVDCKPGSASSARKSVTALDKALSGLGDVSLTLKEALITWKNEYTQVMAAHARLLQQKPDPVKQRELDTAKAKIEAAVKDVETAKQKFEHSVELKCKALQKLLASLPV